MMKTENLNLVQEWDKTIRIFISSKGAEVVKRFCPFIF
jgi:hypothetical protein